MAFRKERELPLYRRDRLAAGCQLAGWYGERKKSSRGTHKPAQGITGRHELKPHRHGGEVGFIGYRKGLQIFISILTFMLSQSVHISLSYLYHDFIVDKCYHWRSYDHREKITNRQKGDDQAWKNK